MQTLRHVIWWESVGWCAAPIERINEDADYTGVRWEAAPYGLESLYGWRLRDTAEKVRAAVQEATGCPVFYIGPRLVRRGRVLAGTVPLIPSHPSDRYSPLWLPDRPYVSLCTSDPEWVAYHEGWHYRHGEGEAEADAYAERMTGRPKPKT